jgi:hypothetical protein
MTARLGLVRATVLLIAALPGLAASLIGCGTTTAAGTRDTNPQPSPTTSPPPPGHLLGESVGAGTGFVLATGFRYTQPAASGASPPPAGNTWAAADVQACAQQGTIFPVSVSDGAWSLRLTDGTAVSAWRGDDPGFPQPRYAETPTSLQAGQCARGWVVFEVPANNPALLLRYSPQGAEPIDWRIE